MVTVLGIRETPLPKKPPPIQWVPYVKSLWIDPRKHPDFAWVWVTRFLVMLGFYSFLPFVNFYLADVIKVKDPREAASELIALFLVFATFSGIGGGYLSDRIGRKKVVYLSNTLIAIMAVTFIACRTMEAVVAVGILFGLGFGAYTSVDWALGTDVLPSKADAGKEMAVWHISMTLPFVVASPVAGLLISSFGKEVVLGGEEPIVHYNLAGYSAVFILCAVCFALGAFFLKNVRGVK
jgi:MFS family permease